MADIQKALSLQTEGKLDEAEKIYLEFLKDNPSQPDVSNLLVLVYLQRNEFDKALYFKIFGGVTLLTAGIAGVDRIRKFFKTIDIYGIRESDIQEIFFSSKYHNIKFYNITKIVFDASEYYDQDSKYLEEHHKFGVMKRIISHYTMYSEVEKFRMNVASFYPINQNDKLLKPLHYSIYEPTYSKDYMIIDSFLGNEYLYIIYDINWNKKEKKSCLYALKLTPEQYMTTVFVNTNSIFERSTITNGSIND